MEEFQNCPSRESVSLVAPDRAARIEWFADPYDATKTGACAQDTSKVTQSDVTKISNVNDLYFVNVKTAGSSNYDYVDYLGLAANSNGQPPTVGQSNGLCPAYSGFVSKDGKYKIDFSYTFSVNTNPSLSPSQMISPPSQATLDSVKQTLLSYYYK